MGCEPLPDGGHICGPGAGRHPPDRLVPVKTARREKVLERDNGSTYSEFEDVLECGHVIPSPGPNPRGEIPNPRRRRCVECGPERPAAPAGQQETLL